MNYQTEFDRWITELHQMEDEGRSKDAALRALEIASQARSQGAEGYALFFEGEALCLEGALRQGSKLQRQAVELLPDDTCVRTSFAVILSLLGQVQDALKHLDQVLHQDPNNIDALGQRGVCLAKMGYNREALDCFESILSSEPENLYAQRNKAVILSRLGQEQEALDLLNRVLENAPQDGHARSEKAILLDEMRLRGTPLGWILLWFRKTLVPFFKRLRHPGAVESAPSPSP